VYVMKFRQPVLAAVVLCLLGGAAAFAQETNGQRLRRYAITEADLSELIAIASLDPEQSAAARRLREGRVAAFDAMVRKEKELSDLVVAAERGSPERRRRWDEHHAVLLTNLRYRVEDQGRLVGDIRAILREEQLEHWPRIERLRRRLFMTTMGGPSIAQWCHADLYRVLRDAAVPLDGAQVKVVLDEYEVEVDRALVEWERLVLESLSWTPEESERQENAAHPRYTDIAVRIGRSNRKYLRRVMADLPPETAIRTEAAARAIAFASFHFFLAFKARPALREALALDDVTEDQRKRLSQLQGSYERECQRLVRAIQDVLDANEDAFVRFSNLSPAARVAAMEEDRTPARKEWVETERSIAELDERTLQAVRQVLTEKLREKLDASLPVQGSP
jgi:hypothetical protein